MRWTYTALTTLVCAATAVQAAPLEGYDPAANATRPTVEIEHSLTDANRGREIPLRITAPAAPVDGEPALPVIIFSHGLGGSNRAFPTAAELWASAGYIVIRPTHVDSNAFRSSGTPRARFNDPETWKSRALDQTAILDALPAIIAQHADLTALNIDTATVATAGHSFGSQTAHMLAGATLTTESGELIDLRDERIDAAVPISVQTPGTAGFTASSYAAISVPVLMITGTKDATGNGETGLDRTGVYDFYPEADAYMLFIAEAAHSSFQDRSSMGRAASRITRTGNSPEVDAACALHTRTVALAFFDAHLKGDEAAHAWLDSDAPSRVGESTAVWLWR